MAKTTLGHWSELYAGALHNWQVRQSGSKTLYYRRLGIVENAFDSDGTDYEGRADINTRVDIELTTNLTATQMRERILFVWAVMRHRHPLMASTSQQAQGFISQGEAQCWLDKYFVYESPTSLADVLRGGSDTISFLSDHYSSVDHDLFHVHAMNSARVFDETQCLCRLFVLPLRQTARSTIELKMYMVTAHAIADGLSMFRRLADFVRLLNLGQEALDKEMKAICSRDAMDTRLPPAQESLYPQIASNKPRIRWQWLITRILRHVRRPLPPAFQNPLRRTVPLESSVDLPHEYSTTLNYNRKPPLNSYSVGLDLPLRATKNLIRLCRQAGISRGSGTFVMVAMVMMRMEETRNPNIPWAERLPFIGSLPINPRPFLSGVPTSGVEDSVMLAFGDGVVLPHLPSDLNLEASFRVLGRSAHRQLNQYQKRKRSAEEEIKLGSRSPSQLLPSLYLATMERVEGKVQPERRVGLNPQGLYPARPSGSLATCGISSVGDVTAIITPIREDTQGVVERDMSANLRNMSSTVRARDGEFLVGAMGSKQHQGFLVSYDGSAIDPAKVPEWKSLLYHLLDYDESSSDAATLPVSSDRSTACKL